MPSKLETATVRAISRELMDELEAAFAKPKYTHPDDFKDHDAVVWGEAQCAVLNWIRERVMVRG